MIVDFFNSIPTAVLSELGKMDLNLQVEGANPRINGLLNRTVLFGGKRLRPLLTFLMADLFGVDFARAELLARSVEQVHAASLSHDDVVDSASTRRGRPSINSEASNKFAVLAGDYLLADVIMALTKRGKPLLVSEMARVIMDLAEGEWLQIEASEKRNYSREIIWAIADKKTASVMSWCTQSPAIEGDFPSHIVAKANAFGRHLGLAFQLKDDVIDFSGESKKDHLIDLENGLVNSVLYEWLELNREARERYFRGEDLRNIWATTHLAEAISKVENEALRHLEEAKNILQSLGEELTILHGKKIEEKLVPLKFVVDFIGNRRF